jgi:ribosome recycling factor
MSEQADLILMETEERMEKAVEVLKKEFAAFAQVVQIQHYLIALAINYYGADTPLKQIASIQCVEGNQLFIKPLINRF